AEALTLQKNCAIIPPKGEMMVKPRRAAAMAVAVLAPVLHGFSPGGVWTTFQGKRGNLAISSVVPTRRMATAMSAETDRLMNKLEEKLLTESVSREGFSQSVASGLTGDSTSASSFKLPFDLSSSRLRSFELPSLPSLPTLPSFDGGGLSLPSFPALPEAPSLGGLGLTDEQSQALASAVDSSLLGGAGRAFAALVSTAAEALEEIATGHIPLDTAALPAVVQEALQTAQVQAAAVEAVPAASAVAAFAIGGAALKAFSIIRSGTGSGDGLPLYYDLPKIMDFYNARPSQLLSRLGSISWELATFAAKLRIDKESGKWEENMPMRARQLREFATRAGPAYVKLGQGVSVRPDILPDAYLAELQKLQDEVKPFSSAEARKILEKELGAPLGTIFADVSVFETPVAAASLGQVYQARLKSGEPVAVKVQRPGVLGAVTLDLYVARIILLALARIPSIQASCLAALDVVDNFAGRFVQECDYEQEARNGDRFRREMAASPTLGDAIIVPKTYTELTTRYVLITEWVEGVKVNKIDAAAPGGRERLSNIVATLLNAYLVQLLESGFLHADPHPGNFLCTPDGRLAVLDFGLMTEIAEDRRYALLEYVSHLTSKDYEATLGDLITLGFIPREIGDDPEKARVVAPLLATVLEQLSNGGGAKSVNVETVGEEVEELGKQYPIQIPSWFGLVIRSFGALEGLGLQLDPQYSIVQACFPYLARRLLTEDTPRMHKMLRAFLYGKDGRYLKVDRVDEIVGGYRTFTALAAEASTPDAARGRVGMLASVSGGGIAAAAGAPGTAGSPFSGTMTLASTSGSATTSMGATMEPIGAAPVSAAPAASAAAGAADPLSDPVARDALQLLFAKDGNYVQDLVVEELVRMTDALGREVNLELIGLLQRLVASPLSPASLLRAFAAAPLPLLGPLRARLRLRDSVFERVSSRLQLALELTPEDRESLSTLRRLVEIFRGNIGTSGGGGHDGKDTWAEAYRRPVFGPGFGTAAALELLPALRNPAEVAETARRVAALLAVVGPGARAM
ncbi:unnamed protein product, partial [Phaeothamnion confervicola]